MDNSNKTGKIVTHVHVYSYKKYVGVQISVTLTEKT